MKYSEIILNDDNFDEEIEKLSSVIGIDFNNCEGFYKKIPNNFKVIDSDLGYTEYFHAKILPDITGGCLQAYERGQVAYEFGNGFVIFNYEIVI